MAIKYSTKKVNVQACMEIMELCGYPVTENDIRTSGKHFVVNVKDPGFTVTISKTPEGKKGITPRLFSKIRSDIKKAACNANNRGK